MTAAARSISEIENVKLSEAVDAYADETMPESLLPEVVASTHAGDTSAVEAAADRSEDNVAVPIIRDELTIAAPRGQTVRVDVARLDCLLNLVGELVIDQTRLAQITARLHGAHRLEGSVEQLRRPPRILGGSLPICRKRS